MPPDPPSMPSATVRGFLKNMYHTFLAVQPSSTESLLMPLAQPDHLQIGSSSPVNGVWPAN